MGIIANIKKEAGNKGVKLNSTEETKIEQLLNSLFYLPKDIKKETEFVKSVMTRGADTQERKGFHASALIKSDDKFCLREQVLSLFYKQLQGEQTSIDLMRIFEEGNAIHEKWQRLFIRGGLAEPLDCDLTQFNEEYDLSFTPDIIACINGVQTVIEIKSVNTYTFKKQTSHASGRKQCQLYMYLTGIKKGIVLCEDKNTQEFKAYCYDFNIDEIKEAVARMEQIQIEKTKLVNRGKITKRHEKCTGYTCKMAQGCAMRDVCYKKSKERLK